MATGQTCCHLPGEILNSAAECADRARIVINCTARYKYQRESTALERSFQATQLSQARTVAAPRTAGKTITKSSCLAGRNSRAGPALENEAF
jgi:hypothetical protein